MNDWELLQSYTRRGSEAAFRTLVERYLNLVHSVAMRQVQDAHLAEEVSQAVFILLARKAGSLKEGLVLSGWLFRTTRFVAARARRGEQRRRQREKEAYEMQRLTTTDETWRRVEPMLDEALEQLGTTDRNLVLLRFYEGKNHKEAGAAVGLSEEAARKRGARALEKLRDRFAGRGAALSAAALAAALTANAVQAAPVELTGAVLAASAAKATAATVLPELVRETLNAWRWAKAKTAALWLTVGAGATLLITFAAQHPNSATADKGSSGERERGPTVTLATATTEPKQAGGQAKAAAKRKAGMLRLHVITKNSGEPVAGARLAVLRVPNWEQTYDLATDDEGTCEIPLSPGLGRLDVGVLSPGWGARFASWIRLEDDPVPPEYTLRVEQVTNSVGGWLRDVNGKPVSDATVWIQFGGTGDYSARETPRERVGVMKAAPVATSDGEGHWSCCVIPDENPGFSLEAKHPDFAATAIASSAPGSTEDEKGREAMQQLWAGRLLTVVSRALEVKGRVTDEAGQPIAGARVDHLPSSDAALVFQTDANGDFHIPKLKAEQFGFAVSAEGFAPEYRQVEVQAGLQPVQITLKPGAVLRLHVVDEAGEEVPGATVGMEQWGEHRHVLNWSAQSGPDGRIEWRSAPRGEELELFARKDRWCYTRDVHVTADGEEHTVTMKPALTLSGHVTDAETGVPVESFKVIPGFGEGRGEQVWQRSDTRRGTKGEFKLIFGENRQPWQVRVEAEGYQPVVAGPVPPDFSGVYEIAMKRADPGTAVRGVVLLPTGAPAAGASVALLTLDYSVQLQLGGFRNEGFGILTNTDAAGSFAFAANPRAHSVAAVSTAGFVRMRVKNPAAPVTLRLQAWGRVEGTVAEQARSQPLEALALMDDAAMNYHGSVTLDYDAFQAKPDAEGHFLFERVPPGRFSLYLNRAMGTPLSCRTEVEVRPGETTTVAIGGAGRTVTGQLLSQTVRPEDWVKPEAIAMLATKGEPLPHPPNLGADEAGLWAVDFWQSQSAIEYYQRSRSYGLSIATNGSFRAEGVAPGTYNLTVVIGGSSLHKEISIPGAVAPGEGAVDLGAFRLTKGGDPDKAGGQ